MDDIRLEPFPHPSLGKRQTEWRRTGGQAKENEEKDADVSRWDVAVEVIGVEHGVDS